MTIEVPLLSTYTPTSRNIRAELSIGRADSWKSLGRGYARELSVAGAHLHGRLVYKGVRGLLTRFPILVSLLAGALFGAVVMSLIAACVLPVLLTKSATILDQSKPMKTESEKASEDVSETKVRRKSSRSPVSRLVYVSVSLRLISLCRVSSLNEQRVR